MKWTSSVFYVSIPPIMTHREPELQDLLKQVSRSFYLTLRVLPRSIKSPISLAYLLARTSDTIADTRLLPIPRRHEALLQLRSSIQETCEGRETRLPDLSDVAQAQGMTAGEGNPAERSLLMRLRELVNALAQIGSEDRLRIRKLLDVITRGQETDLVHFGANVEVLNAFDTDEELDAYTYDVAGCVGEFWTEMCRAHVFPAARLDDAQLMKDGILFGKGLQRVNILRDIPGDLRRGRCYIPGDQLAEYGLNAGDLLDKSAMERFRPLYEQHLDKAESCLRAGWRYTVALPYRCFRIRQACAWPLLIGVRTLGKLRRANVLDEAQRIKISRSEIRQVIFRSTALYPIPKAWNRLFAAAGDGRSLRAI